MLKRKRELSLLLMVLIYFLLVIIVFTYFLRDCDFNASITFTRSCVSKYVYAIYRIYYD